MIKLRQVVVVEGKYDKNKIKQIFDATVIDTLGFGIFSDSEKLALLRRLAEQQGLLVITDSDSGGLLIRNFLKSCVQNGRVWHAYIPNIPGKEKRKSTPGKERLLGVEGVDDQIIIDAVRRSGALDDMPDARKGRSITKADLYALGFSGRSDSRAKRQRLCKILGLPQNLGAAGLLDVLNLISSVEELGKICDEDMI